MKICSKCKKNKNINDFHLDKRINKPRSYCKDCQLQYSKEWKKRNPEKVVQQNKKAQLSHRLKNIYNISLKEYENLLEKCNNKCMICKSSNNLCIDHCHKTKRVRGILCKSCNGAIGLFKEDEKILDCAKDYLKGKN